MSDRATCDVCPHSCTLAAGNLGICGARINEAGKVVSANYGLATALALDPIEKKPLNRFHSGSRILSYGSFGCNLKCPFCQNSDIATMTADEAAGSTSRSTVFISPEELVEKALELRPNGNIGVAFTYNEPLISPEYIIDVGGLLHDEGLVSVAVTNGYCEPEMFDELLPFIDAFNIDLKCFSENGYKKLGAPDGLHVVKRNIKAANDAVKHVEVTTLIVPGISDDEDLFEEECSWLASVNPDMPLHISRFFPNHKMQDVSPTDIDLMRRFYQIAQAHLKYVYLGNV